MYKLCPRCGQHTGARDVNCGSCNADVSRAPTLTPRATRTEAQRAEDRSEARRISSARYRARASEERARFAAESAARNAALWLDQHVARLAEADRLSLLRSSDPVAWQAIIEAAHDEALSEWIKRWRDSPRWTTDPSALVHSWRATIMWDPEGWFITSSDWRAQLLARLELLAGTSEQEAHGAKLPIELRLFCWKSIFPSDEGGWRVIFPDWVPECERLIVSQRQAARNLVPPVRSLPSQAPSNGAFCWYFAVAILALLLLAFLWSL